MTVKRITAWLLTLVVLVTFIPGFMLTGSAANGQAQITTESTADGAATALGFEPIWDGEETVTFIVEVEGDPLIVKSGIELMSDDEKTDQILAQQDAVMTSIHEEIDETAQKGFVYTSVFNGFSMEGTMEQLDEIKALDGVKNVYISDEMQIVEPIVEEGEMPMLDSAGEFSGVDAVHASGYTGEGIVIAVIDSGCDTSHDFFKTAPKNPRYSAEDIDNLVKTRPLNADVASGNQVYKNEKIPYAYNYISKSADTYMHSQSHGTHVAGIAAGKNGVAPDGSLFSGVAPDAQLLFMSSGSVNGTYNRAEILAALNDAVLLEADVINMSFSKDYADVLHTTYYNEILDRCREAGISIMSSAGNSARGYNSKAPTADRPDYGAIGVAAGESSATAVAAANNSNLWRNYVKLEAPNSTAFKAYVGNSGDSIEKAFSDLEEGAYLEYVNCGLGYPEQFQDVSGKIALIKRGELTFVQKAQNAKSAGAVGVLVYNYDEEIITMADLSLPAASLTLSAGTELLEREDKRLRYVGVGMEQEKADNAAMVADFSSWGINSTLELKPEITAPGKNIYSSAPDNKYMSMSGTSMAAPYMTGITALSLQYYKTNPFLAEFNTKTGREKTDLIENLMMNSATIIRQENGVAYSPRVQGAGLVNMEEILKSRVLLTGNSGKAKLSLGDDLEDTLNIAFDVTNIDEGDITFDKITIEVLTDGYEESADGYIVSDSVSVKTTSVTMPDSVTVPSGKTVTFEAEIKLDAEFLAENEKIFTNGFYIDGYVILESETDKTLKASLPFTGFYGDWGQAPIFDSTIYDEGGSYLADPSQDYETGTYLMANYGTWGLPLGRNPYFPEIVDEKYIAYSTNGGASLNLIMTNFRALKNPTLSIENSEGATVIREESTTILSKFTTIYCAYKRDEVNALEEGEYRAVINATVLGDTERTDELSIPFTLDNTYPEILSVVYDEAGKTVTVKARENHYFSAFYVEYPENSEQKYDMFQVLDEDYAEDGSVTKVIDVSMIKDISEAEIGCIDYALNETYYDMDYFLDKIGAEITDCERLKTMTQAELNIKNNTSEDMSADFVLAFYDDNDRLVATSIKNYKIGANREEKMIHAFFENTQDAAYVKLLVWDLAQQKPVDKLKQFILE